MKWDVAEIDEYQKERGATDQCPFCPSTMWTIITETPGTSDIDVCTIKQPVSNSNNSNVNKAFEVLPLICSNCGFVRSIAFEPMRQWKMAKLSARK